MIDDGMGEGWTSMDGRRRLALGLALTQPREGPHLPGLGEVHVQHTPWHTRHH